MRIGIDIDNVLSNFNDELLREFLIHDKELRNTGIINKEWFDPIEINCPNVNEDTSYD